LRLISFMPNFCTSKGRISRSVLCSKMDHLVITNPARSYFFMVFFS
jgi:hypothetical protein